MGSQSKTNLAYIAGFLDGDGSLMMQIKKRRDGKIGWRFMFTICFYQDSRHDKPLYWIKKVVNIGYISKRNDGMTELRINGYTQVRDILKNLSPFIRFKKPQAEAILTASQLLIKKSVNKLTIGDRKKLAHCMMTVQNNNYITRNKKSSADILNILDLTP